MIIPTQQCDMHVHTIHSHDCTTSLARIRQVARSRNLMLSITDHNRIGGALAARHAGIPVIPGIEVTTANLKDFLVYFYEWDHLQEFYERTVEPALAPGRLFGSRTQLEEAELLDEVSEYGAVVSLAHPYCPLPKRSARLPENVMRRVDAIEVMNFAMSRRANTNAARLCERKGKTFTAGSDSHHISTVGQVTMRAHSEDPKEFLAEVAQGHATISGATRTNSDIIKSLITYLKAR